MNVICKSVQLRPGQNAVYVKRPLLVLMELTFKHSKTIKYKQYSSCVTENALDFCFPTYKATRKSHVGASHFFAMFTGI
jgi:hypothetical protein